MAGLTKEYKDLRENLSKINLVLRAIPKTENKTTLHHLKVQSYILLAHAAFEEYIESIAQVLLEKSVDAFVTSGRVNECVASLIVFETVAQFSDEDSRKVISKEVVENLRGFVMVSKKNHLQDIKDNNGIRLKNQRKIFLSVGLNPEDIDSVTASAMDAFGHKRGGFAHTSKIQINDTRSSATTEVKTILEGLKAYDAAVTKSLAELGAPVK